ncbi:MAG: hypothetical protein KGJ46_10885, partial [Xanthomonadaceae bacterium]|nr:hypothetical protein [Xanthomonadaceae bacterium]
SDRGEAVSGHARSLIRKPTLVTMDPASPRSITEPPLLPWLPEATLAAVSELVSATHSYWRDPHTVREVLRVTRTPFFRGYANGLKAIFGGTLHRRLNAHGC